MVGLDGRDCSTSSSNSEGNWGARCQGLLTSGYVSSKDCNRVVKGLGDREGKREV